LVGKVRIGVTAGASAPEVLVQSVIDRLKESGAKSVRTLTGVGNPPDKPKVREVEFSKKEVLREEVKIYRQPDHGCPETC
jgi:4-hydroxy-3-methylbut-2-enyl diphosphate reductase